MGSLYQRKGSSFWWVKVRGADGKVIRASTEKTDRHEAEQVLLDLERRIRATKKTAGTQPKTVDDYRAAWLKGRTERKLASARDDAGRFRHVSRAFLSLPIAQVTREDVRREVRRIWDEGRTPRGEKLSSRTVRKVYEVLRVMFGDAALDSPPLISANPCTLEERRRELPENEDADPTWRDEAQLSAPALDALLSDARIALYRRVIYGLQFLGAMRVSEAAARRFGDLRQGEPLPRIVIATSWSRKDQELRATKTRRARSTPIHPALDALLQEWAARGWQDTFGRAPTAADLIAPSLRGPEFHLNSNTSLEYLHADLELLGLPRVRQHDGRRTLISLARSAGTNVDLLKWATHGRGPKVVDAYTTPQWPAVCAAVVCVPIGAQWVTATKKPRVSAGLGMPRAGFEGGPGSGSSPPNVAQGADSSGVSRGRRMATGTWATPECAPEGTGAEDDPAGYLAAARRAGLKVHRGGAR